MNAEISETGPDERWDLGNYSGEERLDLGNYKSINAQHFFGYMCKNPFLRKLVSQF